MLNPLLLSTVFLLGPQGEGTQPAKGLQARVNAVRAVPCLADKDFLRVDVDLQLVLTNTMVRPLIVPATPTVFYYRIAPTAEALSTTGWDSMTTMLGRDPDATRRPPIPATPDSQFRILRSGQTTEVPVRVSVLIFTRDVRPTMSAEISSGALFEWTEREWEEAERKWKSVGELWTHSIRSGPFDLTIAKESARKPCAELG